MSGKHKDLHDIRKQVENRNAPKPPLIILEDGTCAAESLFVCAFGFAKLTLLGVLVACIRSVWADWPSPPSHSLVVPLSLRLLSRARGVLVGNRVADRPRLRRKAKLKVRVPGKELVRHHETLLVQVEGKRTSSP